MSGKKTYYVNDDSDFSATRKIEGKIGKSNLPTFSTDCLLLREEVVDKKTGEMTPQLFTVRPVNTIAFVSKKLWFVIVPFVLLSIMFIFYAPLYAIPFFIVVEAFIYFGKPYETINRAKKTTVGVRVISVILFLISSYFLFNKGLTGIASSIMITKVTLFMLILLYARMSIQGFMRKYEKIYKLVSFENKKKGTSYNEESDENEYYVWEKTL
jgi:hypothetical protein